ncbi:hypothetical protein [Arthrospiribacter ruber]|uniref:SpoIIAA-like n=1 Tax=Arthrospiribacter ruber TaxID=2487934 RepID=A0A951J2W7_9BACT|nr:hypothetical protein [Arthrospiribacter ruber]MBW3469563.1 hypothetical protein [Arthrospiribacter ruber]
MPIISDSSEFPLVYQKSEGEVSFQEYAKSLEEWESWLDKETPFLILSVRDADSFKHSSESAKAGKAWLQKNRVRLKWVKGIAMVVPEPFFNSMSKADLQKAFGFPSKAFLKEKDAKDWLTEIFNQEDNG